MAETVDDWLALGVRLPVPKVITPSVVLTGLDVCAEGVVQIVSAS